MTEEKYSRQLNLIFLGIFIIIIAVLAYFFGNYSAVQKINKNNELNKISNQVSVDQLEKKLGQKVDFALFWQVWDMILSDYVDRDQLTPDQLFYGALKGMVASTGDPYSLFLDPEVNREFQIELGGSFEGIGAEIGSKNDIITIVAPLEGMPAEQAGLKAGDKVVKIDGEMTFAMTIMDAVRKIRGQKGTDVTLTVLREGEETPLDITITRGVISVKSVKTEFRADKIYVINVTNFADDTELLFRQAVDEILRKNPVGIILDLRNDPGGYLETSISMASQWLEPGQIVVTEQYNDTEKVDHYAVGLQPLANYPTVVLVNQGSASASEIVAGALQDHDRATIVGQQTFGKGSVQVLKELPDGSALKLTTAKWLTPNGLNISKQGITPDIKVDYTKVDYEKNIDPQLNKAIEILLK